MGRGKPALWYILHSAVGYDKLHWPQNSRNLPKTTILMLKFSHWFMYWVLKKGSSKIFGREPLPYVTWHVNSISVNWCEKEIMIQIHFCFTFFVFLAIFWSWFGKNLYFGFGHRDSWAPFCPLNQSTFIY